MKTVVSLSSPAAKKKKKNKKKILVAPLPGATDYQATTERTQLATAPSKQIENQLPSLNQFAAWVLILVGAVAVLMVVYWCFSFLKKKKRAMSSSSQPASAPSQPPSSPQPPPPSIMPPLPTGYIRPPSLAHTSTRSSICDRSCCNTSDCDLSCCCKNPCDRSCCNNSRSTNSGSRLSTSASMSTISSSCYSTSNQPYRPKLKTILSNDDIADLMLNNFSPDSRHEDLSQLASHHHQSPAPLQSQSSSSQILGENSVRSRGVRGLGRGLAPNSQTAPLKKGRNRVAKY
jgi:hypothetical protein